MDYTIRKLSSKMGCGRDTSGWRNLITGSQFIAEILEQGKVLYERDK